METAEKNIIQVDVNEAHNQFADKAIKQKEAYLKSFIDNLDQFSERMLVSSREKYGNLLDAYKKTGGELNPEVNAQLKNKAYEGAYKEEIVNFNTPYILTKEKAYDAVQEYQSDKLLSTLAENVARKLNIPKEDQTLLNEKFVDVYKAVGRSLDPDFDSKLKSDVVIIDSKIRAAAFDELLDPKAKVGTADGTAEAILDRVRVNQALEGEKVMSKERLSLVYMEHKNETSVELHELKLIRESIAKGNSPENVFKTVESLRKLGEETKLDKAKEQSLDKLIETPSPIIDQGNKGYKR